MSQINRESTNSSMSVVFDFGMQVFLALSRVDHALARFGERAKKFWAEISQPVCGCMKCKRSDEPIVRPSLLFEENVAKWELEKYQHALRECKRAIATSNLSRHLASSPVTLYGEGEPRVVEPRVDQELIEAIRKLDEAEAPVRQLMVEAQIYVALLESVLNGGHLDPKEFWANHSAEYPTLEECQYYHAVDVVRDMVHVGPHHREDGGWVRHFSKFETPREFFRRCFDNKD